MVIYDILWFEDGNIESGNDESILYDDHNSLEYF